MDTLIKTQLESNTTSRETEENRRTFLTNLLTLKEKLAFDLIRRKDFRDPKYGLVMALIASYVENGLQS